MLLVFLIIVVISCLLFISFVNLDGWHLVNMLVLFVFVVIGGLTLGIAFINELVHSLDVVGYLGAHIVFLARWLLLLSLLLFFEDVLRSSSPEDVPCPRLDVLKRLLVSLLFGLLLLEVLLLLGLALLHYLLKRILEWHLVASWLLHFYLLLWLRRLWLLGC